MLDCVAIIILYCVDSEDGEVYGMWRVYANHQIKKP